nr:MAG TPA: hypothetical protein [Caudoviricetes sp.]
MYSQDELLQTHLNSLELKFPHYFLFQQYQIHSQHIGVQKYLILNYKEI